jgi:hypothetical protein
MDSENYISHNRWLVGDKSIKGDHMIRKIIEALSSYYQEKKNWEMKMNEPVASRIVSHEEALKILKERRNKIQSLQKSDGNGTNEIR